MDFSFSQFVPQDVCRACDECCLFARLDSPWRPKVALEEIDPQGACAGTLLSELRDDQALGAVERNGQVQCVFLDPQNRACRVYDSRPFECRLYPFLVLKEAGGAALGVHMDCPYVRKMYQSAEFVRHVEYLRSYFQQPAVADFLRRNPLLAADYAQDKDGIELLFAISPALA